MNCSRWEIYARRKKSTAWLNWQSNVVSCTGTSCTKHVQGMCHAYGLLNNFPFHNMSHNITSKSTKWEEEDLWIDFCDMHRSLGLLTEGVEKWLLQELLSSTITQRSAAVWKSMPLPKCTKRLRGDAHSESKREWQHCFWASVARNSA